MEKMTVTLSDKNLQDLLNRMALLFRIGWAVEVYPFFSEGMWRTTMYLWA